MNGPQSYDVTPEQRALAEGWHGGQSSMLYAVASTGGVSRGTRRPWIDGRDATDVEWLALLVERLRREVDIDLRLARDGMYGPVDVEDVEGLAAWLVDIEAWLDEHNPPTLWGCASCGAEVAVAVSVGDDRRPAEGLCRDCLCPPHLGGRDYVDRLDPYSTGSALPRHVYRLDPEDPWGENPPPTGARLVPKVDGTYTITATRS